MHSLVTENTFNMVIETWTDSLHRISSIPPTMENGYVLASQQEQEQTDTIAVSYITHVFGGSCVVRQAAVSLSVWLRPGERACLQKPEMASFP